MSPNSSKIGPVLALVAGVALVQAQSITTTAGPSMMTAASTLKLARAYSGNNFFDGFNFETADDPTGGYVNYVNKQYAETEGLISVQSNGAAVMRVNSELRASGRGRDSVRLSSKDEYADGVYILDLNHMPVGCGVWPAWWTVVKDGWPTGGEIDIIEGANALPQRDGEAWKATGNITTPTSRYPNRNVASLHTSSNCTISTNPYMTGAVDANTCSALMNANKGCGAILGGNTTYGVESIGSQVNNAGGGWYAMWRDMEVSGGVYVYFWPRNSPNVPDDVRYPNATTTNVAGWGQPGANLTTPSCKKDFANHVIVFNMAFCGDYTAATYTTSGCPTNTPCSAFVMNNPKAFTETYWSINSLRIYNTAGATTSKGLGTPAIIGIAVGGGAFLIILALAYWRYRVVKRNRALVPIASPSSDDVDEKKPHNDWAAADELPPLNGIYVAEAPARKTSSVQLATAKPRTGRTTLAPGKTARHQLDGETAAGFYHGQQASADNTPNASLLAVNQVRETPLTATLGDRRASVLKGERSRLSISAGGGLPGPSPLSRPVSPTGLNSPRTPKTPHTPLSPRRQSTYSRPDGRSPSTASFAPTISSLDRRASTFQGEKTGGSWVG